MNNKFTLDIPKPCAQRWEQMSPTADGKFCSHCSTEVIDFTQMTTAQLQSYFKTHTQNVCGRIDTFQLHQLNNPPAPYPHQTRFSLNLAMASVMALLLSTKTNAQQLVAKPQTAHQVAKCTQKTVAQIKATAAEGTFLIKGIVKSLDDGLPLAGADIKVQELNQSAIADPNGLFKLNVKGSAQQELTLVVSYLGHASAQVKVKLVQKPEILTVSLASEHIMLGKVVVTAPKPVRQYLITGAMVAVPSVAVTEQSKKPSFFKRMWRLFRD
ncbi:carboxypeptidase-like regulatory domain-containing protein [Pedobacter xixiisoli]|uniref:CarboxypepD_reg-like domain-containing protein n=1 Tax=Pedobacter xixiisoli TaxID=1476464 RepID=A0A285ZXI9_9SPHI|nr:carboxypeptidase-like regulatory domain-containing protein [Pedobacter xixiisoli]SOD14340.1 CarboxypepD_reg-like domain-containing protein [Pedobacter xixiisoli]